MLPKGEDPQDIAKRLYLLRVACSGTERGAQAAFANSIQMSSSEWNNLERGTRNVTIPKLKAVRRRWLVSIDWILDGDETGLSVPLRNSLLAATNQLGEGNA